MQNNISEKIFTSPNTSLSMFHDTSFLANIFAHRAMASTKYSQDLSVLASQVQYYTRDLRKQRGAVVDTTHFLNALEVFKNEMSAEAAEILEDCQKYEVAAENLLNFRDDAVLLKDLDIKKKSFDSIYDAYKNGVHAIESKKKRFHKTMMRQDINEIKQLLAQSEERCNVLKERHERLEEKVANALDFYKTALKSEEDNWAHLNTASKDYEMTWMDIAQSRVGFIRDTLISGVRDKSAVKEHLNKMDMRRLLQTFVNKDNVKPPLFENYTKAQCRDALMRQIAAKENGTCIEATDQLNKKKGIATKDYRKLAFNHMNLKKGQKVKQILPANSLGFAFGEKKGKLGKTKRGYYPANSVRLFD